MGIKHVCANYYKIPHDMIYTYYCRIPRCNAHANVESSHSQIIYHRKLQNWTHLASSHHSSMVSTVACYWEVRGSNPWRRRELLILMNKDELLISIVVRFVCLSYTWDLRFCCPLLYHLCYLISCYIQSCAALSASWAHALFKPLSGKKITKIMLSLIINNCNEESL